jgi:hypothetical protein
MTTRTIHPADLEMLLESRVAAARERRARDAAGHAVKRRTSRRSGGRIRAAWLTLAAFGALMAAAIVVAAVPVIDLTTADAVQTHQDAVFLQGGLGAGTGTFDPFLTLSTNDPTEAGYNGAADSNFDQFFGGGRTHSLLISAVPVVTYEGQQYREFSLDANDQGSESLMSVDDIKIFRDNQDDLGDYNNGTETFGTDDSTAATKIFDLDQPIILDSQGLESGSGVSDITVLLPIELFPTDCFYGSLTCDQYLIFYTESGILGTTQGDGKNYDVTAGFEEWRVALQPVVNVTKTATGSVDRTYPWNVEKTADVDSIDLFAGDTASIGWTVTATAGDPTDSNLSVSGTITITNPTGGEVISEDIPATINSVSDLLTQGAIDTGLTVTCPESFPFTLDAGDTLVCTYSGTPPNADAGTNTATANIDISDTETADYSGSAAVAFGVDEVDECVTVTDDNATPGDTGDDTVLDSELCVGDSPGTYTFSTDVGPFAIADCDMTSVTNTARTETNDTATEDTASDSVTVNCYTLGVTKDATPSFGRNFTWTIDKSVSPTSIDMFNGAPGEDVAWTITPHRSDPIDSGYAVSGTITISNPAPIAADDVSVTDAMTGDIDAAVDCDPATLGDQPTVDVPAASGGSDGQATCTYSSDLPDDSTLTNTATATLFGLGYTGTASVDFTGVTPTTTNDTATVTDPTVGVDEAASDGVAIVVDGSASCPDDAGTHDNTATVTPGDGGPTDTASASYTVTCHGLSVSKDATTTFTRNWDWSVAKSRFIVDTENDGDGDPATLTLAPGQTYEATYHVTVSVSGTTDSDWAVAGTITITNDAPIDADDVAVSDVLSDATVAAVDCDPLTAGDQATVDVPANGSAQCTYATGLSDASARTNTATATLFDLDYDSDAVDVSFDHDPTTLEDECVVVSDDNGTPGDTTDDTVLDTSLCADEAPHTYEYTTQVGPYETCGAFDFTNVATIVTVNDENDSGETHSSTYTVAVEIPCPEGCTLTQGYWKTHNDSFRGGAPTDDTWQLLGDVDGDGTVEGEGEEFFLSGQTYFEVMWTAPKGNAYYILAVQYIAANLNVLAGADASAVSDELAAATTLFETYNPAQIAALKGKNGKALRVQFIDLAGTLGAYNEGAIGPGHCDEDGTSDTSTPVSGLVLPPLLPVRRRREV